MRRLRILLLCEGDAESWDSWSGISKSLVDQLRSDGHSVATGDVDLHGTERWAAAALTFSPGRRRWTTRYRLGRVPFWLRSQRARHHITAQRNRVDVILQIGATFQPLGRGRIPYCLCCDSNIRMAQRGALTGYSDAATLNEPEVKAIAERERAVYGGAAAIFPLSERLRRSFVEDFDIPAHRVRAIYAGPNFDLARVPGAPTARADDRPPTVLFVGRQFHRKGGDLLLEAFRRLQTLVPNVRLVVAGRPADFLQGPGITCLGDLDKNRPEQWAALVAAYTSADVFALPTRFEPFGVAFVEAMHFGLPCVGPRAWAVPEIIVDGQTGFTVPVEDIDALTDRLLRLLSDPPLARAMGEAGRERARCLFTWPHVVARMSETLAAVAQGNGSGE